MTISFRRPFSTGSNIVNGFSLSGFPAVTNIGGGEQIFNVHPAAHTYNGHALYTLLFVMNTHGTARTYTNLKITPTIVGTAKSTVTIGLGTQPTAKYISAGAGTYSRTVSTTTATITMNSHGLNNNDVVYLDFASGTADGYYTVAGSTTNTFTVTTVETTAQTGVVVNIYSPGVSGIANPYAAPAGVTFGSSVTITSLAQNQVKAVWLKRVPIAYTSLTATNGINADGDVRLNITGDYT